MIPSYLLNLKRRPDRLESVLKEFGKISTFKPTIIEAVDGSKAKLPEGWPAGGGAFGCNQSHIKILQQAIASNQHTVAVFEDDVVFCRDFDARYNEFMAIVPDNWNAIFLGGQVIGQVEPVVPGVLKAGGEKGVHRTHSYLIRSDSLKFMLNEWQTNMGHIDHVWGRNQKNWNVYLPEHWLCAQGASKSDINGRLLGTRWWANKKCGTCANAKQIAARLQQPPREIKKVSLTPEQVRERQERIKNAIHNKGKKKES